MELNLFFFWEGVGGLYFTGLPPDKPLPIPGTLEGSSSVLTGITNYGMRPAVVHVMFLCYCQYVLSSDQPCRRGGCTSLSMTVGDD